MKIIALHFSRLVGALVVVYAALLAVTLALAPNTMPKGALNTHAASQTLFMTEPKYMMLNRDRLAGPERKVILVGASNSVIGFDQPTMSALLPDVPVHNLAIGGANMTEVRKGVDFIDEVQAPIVRRNNIYVIGIWYGMFADDQVKWYTPDRNGGDTDLDIEAYRYGFYRRTEAGPTAVLPPKYLKAGVVAIHPLLAFDDFSRQFNKLLGKVGIKHQKPELTDDIRNATVLTESQRQGYLADWRNTIKTQHLSDKSFAELDRTIRDITDNGGQVIVVDLPIPRWHAEASPYEAEYHEQADRLMAAYADRPQVSYVKLQGLQADDNFYDEVHPKPRVVPEWCRQLSVAVRERLGALETHVQTASRE